MVRPRTTSQGVGIGGLNTPTLDLRSELLATGETVPPRSLVNNHTIPTIAFLDQRIHLSFFKAKRTETISNLSLITGSTAAAATPTLVRFGVYSVDAAGNLTLVASTPNDTTIFSVTFSLYTKALTVAWSKISAQEYALGALIASAGAMPQLTGLAFPASGTLGVETSQRSPMLTAFVAGQADLPGSIAVGSLVNPGGHSSVPYWRMS